MNKILITGVNGFAGSYLAEYILTNKLGKIYGTIRRRSNTDNIKHIINDISLTECDFRDSHSIDNLIAKTQPDKIFHLAAQSFVPTSWKVPSETFESNILGTLNLLEAVRNAKIKPVIQIACSSEEYGLVYKNELPIKETNPLRPLSPYAVSKVGQDMLGYQYYKSYDMKIIRTRAFNHSGARRPADFVDSCFAKQVAEYRKGRIKVISHGNLDAIRDFTDVRDIVRAYWLASESKELYGRAVNICSGKGVKIKDMLKTLTSFAGLKGRFLIQDSDKMRPSDVPVLIGDNSLIKKTTGWKPTIKYNDTLKEMYNYWLEKI